MSEILEDGFKTLISFSLEPSVLLEEITVTPPGRDAGGEIELTTMRNTKYRTKAGKQLVDVTNTSLTVAYDPAVIEQIDAMIGQNQLITITHPDGDTDAFWGFINTFEPGENSEGERPTADMEIIATNRNDSKVETGPDHTSA